MDRACRLFSLFFFFFSYLFRVEFRIFEHCLAQSGNDGAILTTSNQNFISIAN